MKIFLHTGKGHYIGSACVVVAEDQVEAEKFVRGALDESGLKDEALNVKDVTTELGIVFFDNGDY